MTIFMRNIDRAMATALLLISSITIASANTITYNFDTFGDGISLTNQYAGLDFTNAKALKKGFSLNEYSFPPHSGDGAVFDDGGHIVVRFSTMAHSVSGYFTYMDGLTLSAYDSNNNLLAIASAAYLTNLADGTGDPGSVANELLSVTNMGNQIASIVISSSVGGSSLVLDDLTITTSTTSLPEPKTLSLVLCGFALIWRFQAKPYRS